MRQRFGSTLALVLLALCACVLSGCRLPWEKTDDAAKAANWVDDWKGSIQAADQRPPPDFRLPPPPKIELPPSADEIALQSDQSADELAATLNTAHSEVKPVYCQWFSYYVETGNVIPSEEEFPRLLLQHILGRVLPPAPLDRRIQDAANSLRSAIERGQSTEEDVANAAMVGVCS